MEIIKLTQKSGPIFEKVVCWNYEKFGWEFVEFVDTFEKDAEKERLYRLEIQ